MQTFLFPSGMPFTRAQKQKIIEGLQEKMSRQKTLVFIDIKGLKVKEMSLLKKKLKEVDANLQVIKKTLFNLVCKERGIIVNPKELPGQLALVFGFGDEVMPAKTVHQFAESHMALKIIGGYFEKNPLSAQDMINVGRLPSKQELLAKMVGSISAPISGFANVLQGNIKGLVLALNATRETKQ